ncbi:MAG TPA: ABC transporter permease [Bacteroidota bacterium]|nr:ABC transporter permease [Bacteroidota bacterium]
MAAVERFIARRYLSSKHSVRFINVISLISVVGITVGVAALLIALSVFNGFNAVVTAVLVGFDPHIRIEKQGNFNQPEIDSIQSVLRNHPEIKAFAPFISGKGMLVARSYNKVVYIRGVDENRIAGVSGLKEKIVLGSISFHDSTGTDGIVIGLALADRLASVVGDEIAVVSPSGFQSALSGLEAPKTMKYRVSGIFESNNKDYDAGYAYVSIDAAQRLFDMEGAFSGLELRLSYFNDAEHVKEMLMHELPAGTGISTWYDLHQSLYSVMRIERWSAYVLLCLIILVATFNMVGSLTMAVIEKRRDIGVLKAMGMTPRRITRVFMVEGLLIGAAGTVLGICIGLGVLGLQIRYQIFPLDPTVYIIPAIPVEIHWSDFFAIALASTGLSFLAAYYPARRAAGLVPTEALRWE